MKNKYGYYEVEYQDSEYYLIEKEYQNNLELYKHSHIELLEQEHCNYLVKQWRLDYLEKVKKMRIIKIKKILSKI